MDSEPLYVLFRGEARCSVGEDNAATRFAPVAIEIVEEGTVRSYRLFPRSPDPERAKRLLGRDLEGPFFHWPSTVRAFHGGLIASVFGLCLLDLDLDVLGLG